jgi:hypothetical protein
LRDRFLNVATLIGYEHPEAICDLYIDEWMKEPRTFIKMLEWHEPKAC